MQVLTIVLLMICKGQNPGLSTSGTSRNKFSKTPPPTSMHLWTRRRVLRVARHSSDGGHLYGHMLIRPSYYDACDVRYNVIYYVIAVRARRMVRIFFLPYLGNPSKSDPCSYKLFCLESHILSFTKVLHIPPESPCIKHGTRRWNWEERPSADWRISVTAQKRQWTFLLNQIFCSANFSSSVTDSRRFEVTYSLCLKW